MVNVIANTYELRNEYLQFCKLRKKALTNGKLDLSRISFFYPTLLLPLGIFIKKKDDLIVTPPEDPDVASYYEIIMESRENEPGRSYIPILEIPLEATKRNTILDNFFTDEIYYCGGSNAFGYYMGELVDNIYEHSEFSLAYIMAQRYPKKEYTEICIIDNGISIPKSFEIKNFEFKHDIEALNMAMEGVSTKSKERGFGLRTSIKLLSDGLNASCQIISRRAALTTNRKKMRTLRIRGSSKIFDGTLISFRIPDTNEEVDIYDFVEE